MATKIVTKNSSTASAVPTASDLVQGELAVNVADKRLFTEDNGGSIVELGTNPSGNITFQDNGKAIFGAGSDLQIYHTGAASKIVDTGTGVLEIQTNGAAINLTGNSGAEFMARFISDGASQLYYDGSAKLATTSTGIDVTGTATMDGLEIATTASDTGVDLTLNGNKSTNGGIGSIIFNNNGDSVGMIRSNRASANDAADMLFYTQATGGSNTERMRIDSSGNVGIGNSGPSGYGKFVVQGTGNLLNINATSGAASQAFYENGTGRFYLKTLNGSDGLAFIDADGSTEAMRIDSSGNVGIGNSSPSEKLDVNGIAQIETSTSATRKLRIKDSVSSQYFDIGVSISSSQPSLTVSDGTDERMRIDSSGNVQVKGGNELRVYRGDNATYGSMKYLTGSGGLQFNDKNGDGISFVQADGATEYARIDSSGNVGIGTTANYSNRLYIQSDATGSLPTNQLIQQNDSNVITVKNGNNSATYSGIKLETRTTGASGWLIANEWKSTYLGDLVFKVRDAGTSSAEAMRIDSSGNLLVGTTTSAMTAGGVRLKNGGGNLGEIALSNNSGSADYVARFLWGSTPTLVGNITVSSTATTYNTSSDQRLKENIADADDAGSKIDAIQVRQYDWKADGSHQDYGMIAQELQAVAPEAVSGDADSEEMMGVDYSKLVPMLIKEIQSLRNRVAQLEE